MMPFGPSQWVPRVPGWNADFFRDGASHQTVTLPRQANNCFPRGVSRPPFPAAESGVFLIGILVYHTFMAEHLLTDDSTVRKRLLLGALALLLLLAIGSAYAVTLITRMDGNTLYGNRGDMHAAIKSSRGLQYITSGNIDLEGRDRHYQQVYLVLAPGLKAPAKALAGHVYRTMLSGGWPHERNVYVKSTFRDGNMYIYKAMGGPIGKFIWVAAMRHGHVVNLISYAGRNLDLPLDEQEFDTLVQWVRQNQSN